MREILFRGKRMDNGEWVEGFLVKSGEAHRSALRDDLPFSDCYIFPATDRDIVRDFLTKTIRLNLGAYHVIPESVSQYTGLCDKNGKRIFEGDIIEIRGYVYCCCWDEGNLEFMLISKKESFGMGYAASSRMTVIGNVYDNPGLLEVDNG